MRTHALSLEAITKYVEDNIGSFHEARLKSLRELELKQILKRKNPYLFKAKHVIAVPDLVKLLLNAHLSSQEETMFGEFLEGLAIYVCKLAYGGKKSNRPSIDLEFEKEKNEEFMEEYAKIVTTFTVEFANEFCTKGKIDWVKLVKFNSRKKR